MPPHRARRLPIFPRMPIAAAVTCGCLALAPSALARTDPPSVFTAPGARLVETAPGPTPPRTIAARHPAAEASAPTVIRTIDDGFDWGSAGIGAGAGAALVLLALGGVRVSSRARLRPVR